MCLQRGEGLKRLLRQGCRECQSLFRFGEERLYFAQSGVCRQARLENLSGGKLVEFLKWALTKGEEMAKDLHYAPPPTQLRDRVLKRVSEIKT